jgi:proline iminopeptidase
MAKFFTTVIILLSLLNPLTANRHDSLEVPHGKLHYYTLGSGKPIVMLSGGPGWNANAVLNVAQVLARNYQPILVDQRGSGRSIMQPPDSSTINIDLAIDDLERLRKALKLEKLNIYGHSWGGMLSLAYTNRYPEHVNLLILNGSGEISYPDYYTIVENAFKARVQISDQQALGHWRDSTTIRLDPLTAEWETRRLEYYPFVFDRKKVPEIMHFLRHNAGWHPTMHHYMWQSVTQNSYHLTGLGQFKGMALIVFGWQDPVGVSTFYSIKQAIPQAEVQGIDACGHFPSFEQPEAFYRLVQTFLTKYLPPQGNE